MTRVTTPRELCEGYGYPPVVEEILEEMLDAIRRHIEPLGIRSVMLGGSACRGELTWLNRRDGSLDMLSDIDAAVFAWRRDPVREAALKADLHALTERHARCHLFHVDAGLARLYMKRHTIWTYEFRMAGVTLMGEDIRPLLPHVTADSVDLGATADLVGVRLWNQLLHTPPRVVAGGASAYERLIFSYVTARNILELPTILLPHHGVLRPGYGARDAWLDDNPAVAAAFGPEFAAVCRDALAIKRHPRVEVALGRRLHALVDGYGRLTAHLARLNDRAAPDDVVLNPLDERYDRGLARALREQGIMRWRRRLFELPPRLRRLRTGDVRGAFEDERPAAVRFLLAAHAALAHRLDGDMPAAELALDDAERLADRLGRDPLSCSTGEWRERWECLREWYVRRYAEILYKGNQKKVEETLALTRWEG